MRYLLVDVDTQVDFMAPKGALYVPGAAALAGNLAALVTAARDAGVPHFATVDTHTLDDPEFAAYGFPAHCVAGTTGHGKITATRQEAPLLVDGSFSYAPEGRELAFPKATFDVYTNPAFPRAVEARRPDEAIVCGVATDYCVKAAVLGLLAQGVKVALVADAIAAVTPETGATALAEMQAAGARLVTTAQAVALLAKVVAHVA
ncbi:MAG: isochorismatase hydrolase [Cyanobacteria bacterium RYN_339]|nr:isochorismatase hydrolase [Cyanobacteria bacterium RYN_339]